MTGPLNGVKVVEVGTTLLGPYCGLMLAEFGADVIKVENPKGDITRSGMRGRHPGMSGDFLSTNHGKRSLVLDLKQPAAQRALLRVVAGADVFVHNVRPTARAELGIDYERLKSVNPRLVYCGAYGYGEGLPYSGRPAYDDVIQGASGVAALQGTPHGRPQYVVSVIVDKTVAIVATSAICAALFARDRTGEGQAIEVPMYEVMSRFVLHEQLGGWTFEPPFGPIGYPWTLSPYRRPYRTADGFVSALMYTDRHWTRFFHELGRDEVLADERFSTREQRLAHIDQLYALVDTIFEERTTAQWVEVLGAADIPVAPVASLADLVADEHLGAAGVIEVSQHATEGTIRRVREPVLFPAAGRRTLRDAPRLGEHSVEVLEEAALSAQEIGELLKTGATLDGR
jgi:crotonobetainyl-CoA:carnitine CoA-transferase CaiB-like acyl-CoA transferase